MNSGGGGAGGGHTIFQSSNTVREEMRKGMIKMKIEKKKQKERKNKKMCP